MPKEDGTERIYFDPDYKGLTLRVGKTYKRWEFRAAKSGDAARKIRRIKIGPYPATSPSQARQRAREYGDAKSLPRDEAEMTFADAWKSYEERLLHKGKSPSTLYSYRIAYRQLEEIHNMTLRHLSDHPDIVRRIHSELTTKGWQSKRQNPRPIPRAADEAAKFVGAVYKNAKRHQRNLPAELPTTSVNWNRENPDLIPKRVSYAFTELAEWERWRETIKNPVIREMALFLLLSGLRDEDCRTMRWDEINGSVLHRPKPKGGKSRAFDVPLSDPMLKCLERAKAAGKFVHEVNAATWVWPAESALGHVRDAKSVGLKPHALRRTYATCALEAGVLYATVSQLLNHKLPGVTALYARREKMLESLSVEQAKVSAYLTKGLARISHTTAT